MRCYYITKQISALFFTLLIEGVQAQGVKLIEVGGCVDFNRFSHFSVVAQRCFQGMIQAIPNQTSHYLINGVYGITTPYAKFRESCISASEQRRLPDTFRKASAQYAFLCPSVDQGWVLFAEFNESRTTYVMYVESITHYTCSTLDFNTVSKKLIETIEYFHGKKRGRINLPDIRYSGFKRYGSYEYFGDGEYISANHIFDKDIDSMLNCPGGVILKIKIDLSNKLRNILSQYLYGSRRYKLQ
jgi:hypothetical protein